MDYGAVPIPTNILCPYSKRSKGAMASWQAIQKKVSVRPEIMHLLRLEPCPTNESPQQKLGCSVRFINRYIPLFFLHCDWNELAANKLGVDNVADSLLA